MAVDRFSIQVDAGFGQRVRDRANAEGKSVNNWIAQAMELHLGRSVEARWSPPLPAKREVPSNPPPTPSPGLGPIPVHAVGDPFDKSVQSAPNRGPDQKAISSLLRKS